MGKHFKSKSKIMKSKQGVMKKNNSKIHKPNKFSSKNAIAPTNSQKSVENEPFDITTIDEKIVKFKALADETNNRKAKKKIRQLEYLKKKRIQIQNTLNSLKVDGSDDVDDVNISEIDVDLSEQSDKESSEEDSSNDKTETMKGIKRFVVFVGNLPKSVTEDDLKNHFSKVGNIKSVRIPESKESRKNGFAFIELNDRISFEKTLSMHHTMLNNRRVNVLFTNPDGTNIDQKELKKKNAKFDAMRKAGLLAGSVPEHKKRSFRRKKKRLAEEAKAAANS